MHSKYFLILIILFAVFTVKSIAGTNDLIEWKFKTNAAIYSTPLVDGETVYIGSTDKNFYALDLNTGNLIWKYETEYSINSKAIVIDSLVIFESGFKLIALNKADGHYVWSFVSSNQAPVMSEGFTDYHHSSPIYYNGNLYFGDGWGNLNGVEASTGDLKFQFTITTDSAAIRSTPAIQNNNIYFGDWAGHVYSVSLVDSSLNWMYTLKNRRAYYGMVTSDMIIHDTLLYFGSQHDVFSPLDIKTGQPVWTFIDPHQTYLPSTPVFYDNQVIIGSTINTFRIYSLINGEVNWAFPTDGICFVYPTIVDSVLVMNTSNFGGSGSLFVINCKNGKMMNAYNFTQAAPASPIIAGEKLLVGNGDGNLFAFRMQNLLYPSEDTSLLIDTTHLKINLYKTDKRQPVSTELKNISFACDSFCIITTYDQSYDLNGFSIPSKTMQYIASGTQRNIIMAVDPSKIIPGEYNFQIQLWSLRHPEIELKRDISITITDNSSVNEYDMKNDWCVYPNPANQFINFRNNNLTTEKITLEVFSTDGRLIFYQQSHQFEGNIVWNIDDKLCRIDLKGLFLYKIHQGENLYSGLLEIN